MISPLPRQSLYVSYDRDMACHLNNRTAAALVNKLSYWFSKYEQGFYKFMEPCAHKLYRSGDSWTEEMGVARRTLNRAFDLIGVRYRSKRLFLEQEDPFQGKMFASYIDNDTNQTFYLKNPQALHSLMTERKKFRHKKPEEKGKLSQNVRRATDKMAVPYKDSKKDFKKRIYPPKSPVETIIFEKKGPLEDQIDIKMTEKEEETTGPLATENLLKPEDLSQESLKSQENKKPEKKREKSCTPPFDETIEKAEKALAIWQEETKGQVKTPTLTPHFASKILDSLEKNFDHCLEKWRLFCRLCASSKWLMGETGSDFKAWFIWILKDKVIAAIRDRRYGVSDSLPLTPIKKACPNDLSEEISKKYNGAERNKRLALLACFGAERYQRDFASMTLTALDDGRFFLKFGVMWETRATSDDKQALLDLFQSKSLETVPARMGLQAYLQRWSLENADRHPYLFITS